MKKKNICLVGFMGAGKSRIGQRLAQLTGYSIVSTDSMIIEKEGREIADIFKNRGESYFRQIEKTIVAKTSRMQGVIIDCGGGVVLDPINIANLKANGIVFYLSATPETIYNRVKSESHRPLLNVSNPMDAIRDLLDKRQSFYEQANIIIHTDDRTVEDICLEITNIIQND